MKQVNAMLLESGGAGISIDASLCAQALINAMHNAVLWIEITSFM